MKSKKKWLASFAALALVLTSLSGVFTAPVSAQDAPGSAAVTSQAEMAGSADAAQTAAQAAPSGSAGENVVSSSRTTEAASSAGNVQTDETTQAQTTGAAGSDSTAQSAVTNADSRQDGAKNAKSESAGVNAETAEAPSVQPASEPIVAYVGNTGYATLADAVTSVQGSGTVKIVADITLTSPITIPNGKSITLTTDEQARKVSVDTSMPDDDPAFTVEAGAALTLDSAQLTIERGKDRVSNTVANSIILDHGTLVLNQGTLHLNANTVSGTIDNVMSEGAVTVSGDQAVFTMNGGAVNGNGSIYTMADGVKVCSNGKFYMNGGTVKNFWSGPNDTGAVLVLADDSGSAYFEMNDGSIENNMGYKGSGVHVMGESSSQANVLMKGGTITKNTAEEADYLSTSYDPELNSRGAGVFVEGENAHFTMEGGSITENKAVTGAGGGVAVKKGWFTLDGGAIDKNVSDFDEQGNGGDAGGLYVESDHVVLKSGSLSYNTSGDRGGAVFVEYPYTLHVYDALMTENSGFVGAAIYSGEKGSLTAYATNGAAFYDNRSFLAGVSTGGDVAFYNKGDTNSSMTLPDRALGAGEIQWYPTGRIVDTGDDINGPEYVHDPSNDPVSEIKNSRQSVALHPKMSEAGKKLGQESAKLIFEKNVADSHRGFGGAIAAEGNVIIGRDQDYTLTVNKEWAGTENNAVMEVPVEASLKVGDTVLDPVTLDAEHSWESSFHSLPDPATLINGAKYSVVEESVPDNFTVSYQGVQESDAAARVLSDTVTNTLDTTEVSGTVFWDDNNDQDGKRPDSVKIDLMADGQVVATVKAKASEGWQYSVTDLPKFKDGQLLTYTVNEEPVDAYTATVEGFNITNTHVPETVAPAGTVTWDDDDDRDGIRPESIDVKLIKNGDEQDPVETRTVTADENGDWTFEFSEQPKYENGQEINYTVSEEAISGYTTSIVGFAITNTHTPGTISVSGTKTWEDNNDQDGIRPEKITVNLLANDVKVDSQEVSEASDWKYTFANLPKFENGQEIVYTIIEDAVDGYETKVEGYDLTNTHVPGTISVSGTKTWEDNNDQDGIRPEKITVNLLANGAKVDSQEVSKAGDWKYTFANLPKFENGQEITYTVSEEPVDGYEVKVEGYDLTNTHTPAADKPDEKPNEKPGDKPGQSGDKPAVQPGGSNEKPAEAVDTKPAAETSETAATLPAEKTVSATAPQTGVAAHVTRYVGIAIIAVAVIVLLIIFGRRKKK